jgi:hypothetical protein
VQKVLTTNLSGHFSEWCSFVKMCFDYSVLTGVQNFILVVQNCTK